MRFIAAEVAAEITVAAVREDWMATGQHRDENFDPGSHNFLLSRFYSEESLTNHSQEDPVDAFFLKETGGYFQITKAVRFRKDRVRLVAAAVNRIMDEYWTMHPELFSAPPVVKNVASQILPIVMLMATSVSDESSDSFDFTAGTGIDLDLAEDGSDDEDRSSSSADEFSDDDDADSSDADEDEEDDDGYQ